MISVGLISWWYGDGLKMRYNSTLEKTAELFDFFSIGILVRTLFLPYKQISASEHAGSIGEMTGVFLDKLVSRIVGFVVRFVLLIVGLISFVFQQLIHAVTIVGWVIIPLMPIVGLVLAISGWSLSWII